MRGCGEGDEREGMVVVVNLRFRGSGFLVVVRGCICGGGVGWGEGSEKCFRVAVRLSRWDGVCCRRGPGAGGVKILCVHLILCWAL